MGVLGKTRDEAIDKPGKSENLAPCSRNQREVKRSRYSSNISISRSNITNIHKIHGNSNGGGLIRDIPEESGKKDLK